MDFSSKPLSMRSQAASKVSHGEGRNSGSKNFDATHHAPTKMTKPKAAVRRPVIALLGPTVPAFGYLPYGVPAEVLERPVACRPCSPSGSDHCPLGHHRCMIEIEPEAVAAAVERAA